MELDAKIYVAGNGMVGTAIQERLKSKGYTNIVTKTKEELDLTRQEQVEAFFVREKPAYVFLAAAKVGGIIANSTYPADFIYQNLMIESNVIRCSFDNGVKKLLFLGSACIYPKMASQPINENSLLTGELEKSNEAYALAKIAGLKMCEYYNKQYGTDYISCMPTNLYGKNDNYHTTDSHVLPALLRRFHEAKCRGDKEVVVWGTGTPTREFLFVDDLADACIFLMNNYSGSETVNISTGKDITIRELADTIKEVVGFEGKIVFDPSMPDGTPRRAMDVSKLKSLGWSYKTELKEGIEIAYRDFLRRGSNARM